MLKLRSHQKGFTLVELTIVIAVIAILGTLIFVSYNGTSTRAKNAKTISNVKSYVTIIQLYHTYARKYPTVPGEQPNAVSLTCLGLGYPGGKCGTVTGYEVSESAAFMNDLQSVSNSSAPIGAEVGVVNEESFVGGVYGIDQVGGAAPHSGFGRVIEWNLIGENQDCVIEGSYSYATGNGNTACELFLEPTA